MLLSVKDNKVYLQMGGGRQGCEAADITLKAGIERMIKEEIPEIHEVLDTTDHSEYRYEPRAWVPGAEQYSRRWTRKRRGETPMHENTNPTSPSSLCFH